jgi:hypothetical protein
LFLLCSFVLVFISLNVGRFARLFRIFGVSHFAFRLRSLGTPIVGCHLTRKVCNRKCHNN